MKTVISLSLDGGGFQSLSQLFILMEIMQRLEWILKLEASPLPCEHFDFMGGSGSGGIIALLLGRFRLQIEVAIECFVHVYQTISSSSLDKASRSKCLEDVVRSLVQEHLPSETSNTKLRQVNPKCKTFICAMPSTSLTGPKPVRLFRNFRPRKHASFDYTIWEAARATTAHPRLFVPILIGPTWARETFIEPCLRYNNPVELVIEETNSVFPQSSAEACFVSLGAGHPGISSALVNEDDWSSVLQDIAKDCEGIADQVARRYQTGYFRLNVFQGLQGIASEPSLDSGQIASHTQQYLQDSFIDGQVDEIVQLLVRRYQELASPASFTTIIDPKIEQLVASMPLIDFWDLKLDQGIVTCQNYTFCQGRVGQNDVIDKSLSRYFAARLLLGDQTLEANTQAFHPGVIRVFRKSSDYCPNPFLVYSDDDIAPAEFQMSRALEVSDTAELVRLGVSLIGNIASALQFLESKSQELIPLQMTEETFIVFARSNVNTELLQYLCSKTVTNATVAAYPERRRETLYANQLLEEPDTSQTFDANASRISHLDITESAEEVIAQLRLYSWQQNAWEGVTLKEVSAEFAPFYYKTRKTSLRRIINRDIPRDIIGCLGYRRDEIRLSLCISSSVIIIHSSPDVLEICTACGKQHTQEAYRDTYRNTEDDNLGSVFQDSQVRTTIPDILVENYAGSPNPNTPLDLDFDPGLSFPSTNTFKSPAPSSPFLTHNPMSSLATSMSGLGFLDDAPVIPDFNKNGASLYITTEVSLLDHTRSSSLQASPRGPAPPSPTGIYFATLPDNNDYGYVSPSDTSPSTSPYLDQPYGFGTSPVETFDQLEGDQGQYPSNLTSNWNLAGSPSFGINVPNSSYHSPSSSLLGDHLTVPDNIPSLSRRHTPTNPPGVNVGYYPAGIPHHRTVNGAFIHQHGHEHSPGSSSSSSYYSLSPMSSAEYSPYSSPQRDDLSQIQQRSTHKLTSKKPFVGSAAQDRQPEGRVIKHKCEICERGFTTKHNLTNHVNSHHGTLRYTCDLCTRQFTTKVVMERHKKKCKGGHISSA
ncbi:hypothetical protein DL96DRAFT_1819533 [Flagelloscypha sp. PMI_526]|nr:hypothetical protein DL96DRAFT_1819533 [Flagelloscypha sp. PMI_526]